MAGRKESAYYDEARRLYVRENKTAKQIAELLQGEVSENSIDQWAKKGGVGQGAGRGPEQSPGYRRVAAADPERPDGGPAGRGPEKPDGHQPRRL